MNKSRLHWGLGLGAGLAIAAGLAGKSLYDQAQATAAGYLYGYPLVMMELTRQHQLAMGTTRMNDLQHSTRFPDANFNSVVSPNVDTLYSIGHFDLRAEPLVFSIPSTAGHYFMMPIMDAWTNVVASPGTRTIGDAARTYLIAGPNWKGEVPEGMELIRMPTQLAWMIGRIESSGPKDYAEINGLQKRFRFQTLSAWQGHPRPKADLPTITLPRLNRSQPPDQQLATWSQEEFFSTLCRLLPDNPPRAADTGQIDNLRASGLLQGDCQDGQSAWQRLGSGIGYRKVVEVLSDKNGLVAGLPTYNGWHISYDLGEYSDRYSERAAVAKIGLGANNAEDALYPNAFVDRDGQRLNGSNRYVMHFDKAELPPVKGFWSLTLYNSKQLLSANPLDRYALGDRDDLHYNADGSLDLYIQQEQPEKAEQRSNWLPAPQGEFSLFLRLYWPKDSVLDRQWLPPRVDRQS